MKRGLKWSLIIGVIVIILVTGLIILDLQTGFIRTLLGQNTIAAEHPSPDFLPETRFAPEGLTLAENTYILDSERLDINGDRKVDDVVLCGEKQEDNNPYWQNISVAVRDGKSGKFSLASVGEWNIGLVPKIFIGKFTTDKNQDILVSMATGSSGGIYQFALLAYLNGQIIPVISQDELNKGLQLETQCLPAYALKVTNKASGSSVVLDLHKGAELYQNLGIYNEQGQLLADPMVLVDGYGVLEPKDDNGDGIYELHGMQGISVGIHANQVATANSVWTVSDGHLKLVRESIEAVN
jgi:hypothetical protein